MFGRATIRLGIGPHSSFTCFTVITIAPEKTAKVSVLADIARGVY